MLIILVQIFCPLVTRTCGLFSLNITVFFLPDLDRDLLEHPDLPVPPVSVEQGYVHINNNNNNKLYLYTIVIWAKAKHSDQTLYM